MISPMKIMKMEKKWQKFASASKKKMSILPRTNSNGSNSGGCNSPVADRGHFIAYTTDEVRFMIPLAYLKTKIFGELFEMAEEEFGVPTNGPITLPCDSVFLERTISMIRRPTRVANDYERASLLSLDSFNCSKSSYLDQDYSNQELLIYGL